MKIGWLVVPALCVVACGSESTAPSASVLAPPDLVLPEGAAEFDPDAIVTDARFANVSDATLSKLDAFFADTPYGNESFLSAYRAGSTTASLALVNTSRRYAIHPAALLARMQMEQGLISLSKYPIASARVEFVFRCGCAGSDCDPAVAGLDQQLDCMAKRWASAIQRVKEEGASLSGWSVGTDKTTVDGVLVTPKNAATCALYEDFGIVGNAEHGATLFYAIFERYREALDAI